MENNIYVFMSKRNGLPVIFSVAVEDEVKARQVVKNCNDASLKVNYSSLSIKEEDAKEKNGLYVLLEDRMMEGKFYPTGFVLQNEAETEQWITENPVGVERKFEEITIMRPHEALHKIFQNS